MVALLFLRPFAWNWWNQETYDLHRFQLSFNGQWIEAISLDQARNNFNRIRNFFIKMPLLFNSDSNFCLKYFGLKFFLLAAKFIFIFCPWLINFWFYLPNPSPTGAKVKGRGITWHFSPVSVPIRTQLDIYCPVDLYCLLSVSDDSVPIFWLCDYKWGIHGVYYF